MELVFSLSLVVVLSFSDSVMVESFFLSMILTGGCYWVDMVDLLSVLSGAGLLEIVTRPDLGGGWEGDLLSVLSWVGLLWR